MAAHPINPAYLKGLLNTVSKAYMVPYNSNVYKKLQVQLKSLFEAELSGHKDRQQVYETLTQILSPLPLKPPSEDAFRSGERLGTIVRLLDAQNFAPTRVLDIGAGKGDITLAVQSHYQLGPDAVFAIDQKLPEIPSITVLTYDQNRIPLPDHSVDLVLMFELLHHVPPEGEFPREVLMAEAARVLAPGGYLIMRDHDDTQEVQFYVFLDLLHLIWYVAMDETSDPLYLIPRVDLMTQFESLGLRSVGSSIYPEPNPQRIYHQILVKNPSYKFADPSYKFADSTASDLIQSYMRQLRQMEDPSWDDLPASLRPNLVRTYGQFKLADVWASVVRDVGLALIVGAARHVIPEGQTYYLTADAIHQVLESW